MYPKPKDSDVLMETFRGRFKDAQTHQGENRIPKDPYALMTNHYAAIVEGKQHRDQPPSTPVSVEIGWPYLPCTIALDNLRPMKISELKRETHHRGRSLMLRQMGEHSRGLIHVTAVVRDVQGSLESLVFHTADISRPERDIMPSNAVMIIKEPFYTIHGSLQDVLFIDHPSDLVYLPLTDARVPLFHLSPEEADWKEQRTALQWKKAGNAALKAGRHADAATWYSCGLLVVDTSDLGLKKTLYRNRAQANLMLKHFDAAEADALAALQGEGEACKDVESKAYFRAGRAAYSLRQFARAKQHIDCMLALTPSDREGLCLLQLLHARLNEQNTGLYDFAAFTNRIRAGASRLDVADFTKRTEIKNSPGRGRGLFATVDLEPGSLVLCEKGPCISLGSDGDYFQGADFSISDGFMGFGAGRMWKNAVSTLQRNPSKIPAFTDLVGKHPGVGNELITVDGTAIVDVFQIHDIVRRNAYVCGTPSLAQADTKLGFVGSNPMNAGIWIHGSYINHSCLPNTNRTTVGDVMLHRASRYIAKGEEITTAYDNEQDMEGKRSRWKRAWGLSAHSKETVECKQKRNQLVQDAEQFLGAVEPATLRSSNDCARAEGLVADLMSTYDATLYQGIPRLAPLELQSWLIIPYFATKQRSKCLGATTTLFRRLLAFDVVILTETTLHLVPGRNSAMHSFAARALEYASQAVLAAGRVPAAKMHDVEYKKWYLVVNGVMDGAVFPGRSA
ncbi:hypothetical protein LTR86_009842 [Recurvomyces mirabilis]|nr:hypothetical protein LTR86_009842 [Recurvomyces mirabilis]